MSWVAYNAFYNPTGLSGYVGGLPAGEYHGYVDELFPYIPLSGSGITQYRKIYFKNTYPFTLTDCRVYLTEVEHSGQIAVASGSGFSIGQADQLPTDAGPFSSPTGYPDGVPVGDVSGDGYASVWVRLSLTGGEDPLAYARIVIAGTS